MLFLLALVAVARGQSSVSLDWASKVPRGLRVKHFQLSYTPQIGDLPFNTILPPDITRTEIENALPATNYSVVLRAILAGSSALSPLAPFVLLNNTFASSLDLSEDRGDGGEDSPDAPMIENLQINCTNVTIDFFPPDGEGLSYFAEYYPTGQEDRSRFMEFNATSFMLTRLRPYIEYQVKLKAVFRGIPSRYGANTSFILELNGTNCNDSVIPFAQPQTVSAIREGRSLRIEWDKPTDPGWGLYDCNEYKVNYTVLTLETPKSFIKTVPGTRQYLLIKLLRNHALRMEVSCLINDTLTSGKPGIGYADLREPDTPQNFRIERKLTDAFFRSSVLLNYTWPAYHDFRQFPLIVSYYPSSAPKLRKDIEVLFPQAVNVTGLKPSQTYTFDMRNISSFGFESKPTRLEKEVTPPIITSRIDEIERTTTSLVLSVSPTDNDEAKFEQYILVFQESDTVNQTKTRIPSELKALVRPRLVLSVSPTDNDEAKFEQYILVFQESDTVNQTKTRIPSELKALVRPRLVLSVSPTDNDEAKFEQYILVFQESDTVNQTKTRIPSELKALVRPRLVLSVSPTDNDEAKFEQYILVFQESDTVNQTKTRIPSELKALVRPRLVLSVSPTDNDEAKFEQYILVFQESDTVNQTKTRIPSELKALVRPRLVLSVSPTDNDEAKFEQYILVFQESDTVNQTKTRIPSELKALVRPRLVLSVSPTDNDEAKFEQYILVFQESDTVNQTKTRIPSELKALVRPRLVLSVSPTDNDEAKFEQYILVFQESDTVNQTKTRIPSELKALVRPRLVLSVSPTDNDEAKFEQYILVFQESDTVNQTKTRIPSELKALVRPRLVLSVSPTDNDEAKFEQYILVFQESDTVNQTKTRIPSELKALVRPRLVLSVSPTDNDEAKFEQYILVFQESDTVNQTKTRIPSELKALVRPRLVLSVSPTDNDEAKFEQYILVFQESDTVNQTKTRIPSELKALVRPRLVLSVSPTDNDEAKFEQYILVFQESDTVNQTKTRIPSELKALVRPRLVLSVSPTDNDEAKFEQYILVFQESDTVNQTKTRIPSELKALVRPRLVLSVSPTDNDEAKFEQYILVFQESDTVNQTKTRIPSELKALVRPRLVLSVSPTDNDEAKFEQYILVFQESDTVNQTKTRIPSELKAKNYVFENLIPGQTYPVYLYTMYQKVRSRAVLQTFVTYPLSVKKVLPIVTRDLVKLYWEPEESSGQVKIEYRLSYSASDGAQEGPITLANVNNHCFPNLVPDVWFTFTILVVMSGTEAEHSESLTVVTGFNEAKVPLLRRVSAEKLEIGLRPDFFTESNGEVVRYSVIVAENFEVDVLPERYRTWFEVQNDERWPPYQATQDDWQPFSRKREQEVAYVVGSERCEETRGFCNGPLKPDTDYFVKLRACTKEGICMDTDYSKMHTDPSNRRAQTIEFLNGSGSSLLASLFTLLFCLAL